MDRESERPRARRRLDGCHHLLCVQIARVCRLPPSFPVASQPPTSSVPEVGCSPDCVAACLGFWELTLLKISFLFLIYSTNIYWASSNIFLFPYSSHYPIPLSQGEEKTYKANCIHFQRRKMIIIFFIYSLLSFSISAHTSLFKN